MANLKQNAHQPSIKISTYANDLLTVPRAHVRMNLSQDDQGILLSHEGTELIRCPITKEGMIASGFMAEAMGVVLPPIGEHVQVRVSTGVLFRVISIAELDYNIEESFLLLSRLLEEAQLQRGKGGGSE